MSVTDELLANNEHYAASFDKGDLPLPPGQEDRGRRVHGRPARSRRACSASRRATPTSSATPAAS